MAELESNSCVVYLFSYADIYLQQMFKMLFF